jgi:hypothetical protein
MCAHTSAVDTRGSAQGRRGTLVFDSRSIAREQKTALSSPRATGPRMTWHQIALRTADDCDRMMAREQGPISLH